MGRVVAFQFWFSKVALVKVVATYLFKKTMINITLRHLGRVWALLYYLQLYDEVTVLGMRVDGFNFKYSEAH